MKTITANTTKTYNTQATRKAVVNFTMLETALFTFNIVLYTYNAILVLKALCS